LVLSPEIFCDKYKYWSFLSHILPVSCYSDSLSLWPKYVLQSSQSKHALQKQLCIRRCCFFEVMNEVPRKSSILSESSILCPLPFHVTF
jgi:hypothetical protein